MTIANTGKLAGRTLFISGASRGIGKAIALKAARDGANIVVAAKTAEPHPKLPGTIYTAAEEIEKAGGKALPCIVDIRDEAAVKSAVKAAVEKFGGIDILVNNASAISLTPTDKTDMKRFDLMHQINTRGTFLVSKECLPYLQKSSSPHILNLSPPLSMDPKWFSNHVAYTMAKYGMSMCVLGMSEEFKSFGIGVNALWPRTLIETAAARMLMEGSAKISRTPDIMADAAYVILTSNPKESTGNFFIDDNVVMKAGVTDLSGYACVPGTKNSELYLDAFVDDVPDMYKSDGSAPVGQIEGLFKTIEGLLNEDIVKRTNAVYQFNVLGAEAGTWYADLKNGAGKVGKGEPPVPADATLTMDTKNFLALFAGKLKSTSAFMTGRLKIKGDLKKAMALEKLMGALKTKL